MSTVANTQNPATAPHAQVVAYLPAAAARVAGDFLLSNPAPDEYADQVEAAGSAMHDAGWAQDGYRLAAEARRHDDFLDAPGPSVHLPAALADALLVARGWTIERLPQRTLRKGDRGGIVREVVEEVCYVMPGRAPRAEGGKPGTDYVWERDEALTIALTAEALTLGAEVTR